MSIESTFEGYMATEVAVRNEAAIGASGTRGFDYQSRNSYGSDDDSTKSSKSSTNCSHLNLKQLYLWE